MPETTTNSEKTQEKQGEIAVEISRSRMRSLRVMQVIDHSSGAVFFRIEQQVAGRYDGKNHGENVEEFAEKWRLVATSDKQVTPEKIFVEGQITIRWMDEQTFKYIQRMRSAAVEIDAIKGAIS